MKKTTIMFLICILSGQYASSQTTFSGSLNFNQKCKTFSLISATDTLSVSIEKRDIDFESGNNFQLIKIRDKEYNFIEKSDTVKLTESKSKIEYSNGFKFSISKKKAHQIILNDENGNSVLDAAYTMKGNTAYYEIKVFDKNSEHELLAYATKYLYEMSFNEVVLVPYYFFIYS